VAVLLSVPVALAMAACLGTGDEPGTTSAPDVRSTSASAAATDKSSAAGSQAGLEAQHDAASADGFAASEEAAIATTLRTWLLTGHCALMTDEFLDDQTLGIEGSRKARCAYFASIFTVPAFTAEDVVVKDLEGTPWRATAVVTDDFSGAESSYTLVNPGDGGLIEAWNV
jgi:hypothetical protein